MGTSVKRSISLSRIASDALEDLVRMTHQDRSAVLEAAILELANLGETRVVQAVREALDVKRAGTPSGWRSLFWGGLVEEFGLATDVYAFASKQPYGPRTFNNFQVVFLLPSMDGTEDGTLTVHVFENARADMESSASMTWQYALRDSPFDAARKTAAWIFGRGDVDSTRNSAAST